MIHTKIIDVKAKENQDAKKAANHQALLEYFEQATVGAKCMYNVANFYIRNTMTGLSKEKEGKPLTQNEKDVLDTVRACVPAANQLRRDKLQKKIAEIQADDSLRDDEKEAKIKEAQKKLKEFKYPTAKKWMLSFELLDAIFKITKNPDYYNDSVSSHVIQDAIRECCGKWRSYFESNRKYKRSPEKMLGKPHIPGYIHGEKHTAIFDYQVCPVKENIATFPLKKLEFNIGDSLQDGLKIAEVRVVPYCGCFQIHIVAKDALPDPYSNVKDDVKLDIKPGDGVMAIDLGLVNFAAIVDNKGHTPIIIKGGFLKARNQWFNKRISVLRSAQMKGHDPEKYHPPYTKAMNQILRKRNAFLRDSFYKIAHFICRTASERGIKFIIVGKNKNWKQGINIGHKNNQEFVQIPHAKFIKILYIVSRQYGIMVDTIPESYTSKASFLDKDSIPDYDSKNKEHHIFKGTRKCRGLYVSADGKCINADINGACNIGRKYSESVFDNIKDYSYLCGDIMSLNFRSFYQGTKEDEERDKNRQKKKEQKLAELRSAKTA